MACPPETPLPEASRISSQVVQSIQAPKFKVQQFKAYHRSAQDRDTHLRFVDRVWRSPGKIGTRRPAFTHHSDRRHLIGLSKGKALALARRAHFDVKADR
jgi:hypothetical protein